MAYRANRGGHAPGHLRDAFLEWLDKYWFTDEDCDTVEIDGQRRPLRWLIGQLWNCTDILPGSYCDELELQIGSTYAMAVRKVARTLEREWQRKS